MDFDWHCASKNELACSSSSDRPHLNEDRRKDVRAMLKIKRGLVLSTGSRGLGVGETPKLESRPKGPLGLALPRATIKPKKGKPPSSATPRPPLRTNWPLK
ncbi:hypothetical protein NDU88_002324 [Pleurodeles waltl]|uniref:Uncharacterized protein n=1 Tax=Pleurodeles waltl TaxID=8319 RepID=A0AAV7TLG2_PLEWA|nr:hypothetical protein NDU88_002324 [Pleurodeles waltl]